MSAILHAIEPARADLGGMWVRRTLPSPGGRGGMVGPFVFCDQFGPAELPPGRAMDIAPHPHIGLATITWLFEGAVHHRDSLGSSVIAEPGRVNLMTAGRGITHSERSPDALRGQVQKAFGMQTWVALPDGQEDCDPGFETHAELPVIADRGARATVIMGTLWGETAPTTCHSPTIHAEIVLEPGGTIPLDPDAAERGVMLVSGGASLDGEPLRLHDLNLLAPYRQLRLASEHGARVMLLGGEPFTSPRHLWWNFVHSSPERIREAAREWEAGRFPPVPGDPDTPR